MDSCTQDLFTILEQIRLVVGRFDSFPRNISDEEYNKPIIILNDDQEQEPLMIDE